MEKDNNISKYVIGLVLRQGLEDAKRIINESLAKAGTEYDINFYTRAKAAVDKMKDVRGK